jgi:hypothetical protein
LRPSPGRQAVSAHQIGLILIDQILAAQEGVLFPLQRLARHSQGSSSLSYFRRTLVRYSLNSLAFLATEEGVRQHTFELFANCRPFDSGVQGQVVHSRRDPLIRPRHRHPRQLLHRLILGEVSRLLIAGTALGVGVSIAAARLMEGLFYGMRAGDVPMLVVVGAVLILAALFATYIPAHRAASINPVEALRLE